MLFYSLYPNCYLNVKRNKMLCLQYFWTTWNYFENENPIQVGMVRISSISTFQRLKVSMISVAYFVIILVIISWGNCGFVLP